MPWAAQAQETVTIGDGTSSNYNNPIGTYYNYSITEQLYTADEIGMAGTISSISFYYANTTARDLTITVYMKNVEAEDLSTGISLADAAIVFEGTLSVSEVGWATITLTTPFEYDGTSNLLIGVKKDAPGWYSNGKWYYTTIDNMARYSQQDGTTPYTTSTVPATVTNQRPNIQIVIEPASTGGCEKPDELTANGEPTDTEFSFEITGGSGLYNIFTKAGNGDWTNWEYEWEETTVNLTNLESNTAYQVRVQSVCTDMTDPETGDAATSGWKTLSFTTKNPCAAPTNLQVTDITAESATLSWTAGYQETEWTVKYKKSADAWDDAVTITATSPSITLTGLDDNTTYNVQVFNCENYVSANFTTQVGIPLTEAFATTSAPTGWAKYSGLLSDVMGGTALTTTSSGWNFSTGNGVFDNHAKVNLYGTSCKYWLVTPTLLMENNVQLTFDLALTAYSGSNVPTPATNGSDDKFVVLISTDNMATWTILRQWDNAGSQYVLNNIACSAIGEAVAFDLSSYAGQSIAIAFYGESTVGNADNNLHIDNVSIDYIPACAKPTGLAASDVTAHEATITWTSDAEAWQVQLDDEDPIDVEEATYTFENLDPETTYTAKVRANCSGTYSEWTTTVSFTTGIACPAPTALAVTPNAYTATFTWESFAGEWDVAYATDATADPEEFIVGTVYDTASYTVNDLELGDYYFWVRANCGDLDGNSTWAGPASVHIGYCVPNPSSHDGQGITGVSFGIGDYVVTNGDGSASLPASAPFYGDYSSMIGAVQAGVESTIAITTSTGNYPYTFVIWVDFDNSMSFEDSEVVYVGKASSGNGTLEATITIPATQELGDYRMRIYGADSYFNNFYNSGTTNWNAAHDPCNSGTYRHAHDYTLRVLEAPSCLTPTDLTINYAGGVEATISWTSDAEAWNMRVNGVDVNGVITNPYTLTGLELATTYEVEVQANCGSDLSEWAGPVSFTTDLCMPENQCEITFELTDSYGDGWNGAYIDVVDAITGVSLGHMSNNNIAKAVETETYTLAVCDGREIQFVWHTGSYDDECSFVIKDINEEEIVSGNSSVLPFNYTVNCTVIPCKKPTDLAVSEIGGRSAVLSWTENGEATEWEVEITNSDNDSTIVWTAVTNPYTMLYLDPETNYSVRVLPHCVVEKWSEAITFTTLGLIVWDNPEDWPNDSVPETYANVTIPANTQVIVPSGYTAYADTITIEEGGQITIEDGGQLYHSNEVPVTMQLAYDPNYTSSKDGEPEYGEYRLIAAPVNPGVPVSSTGLVPESTDPNYDYVDLYYFDQNVGELVWINYKYEANDFDSLFIKKGYLYSNAQNVLGIFGGNTLPTSVDVKEPLVYKPEVLWAGWNLVGNPFTCMAFVNRPYYKINGDGNAIAQAEGNSLEVFEGVFVYTEQAYDSVTFSTTAPDSGGGFEPGPEEFKMLTLNLNDGRSLIDRAIVRFDEGRQLLKLQMGSSTKVYIPKDGSDYAIVSSDDTGEVPVSFKAENDGTYTMNFSSENVNFSYLHLIDNKTGDDIDLLETPSYTFTARTNDYTNRFKLVFALGTTGIEESFAFFNNGNLVISNEGNATLQVVDVMGRILKSENINGSASVKVDAAPGVYMIRLTNGSNVKVQKVVVE